MQKNEQVDAYIAKLEPKRKQALETLRAMVSEAVPGVEETMSYGMPTYARGSDVVCSFASQKNYISFYMMDTDLVEKHKAGLSGADCGKSCIRFRSMDKAPLSTLRTMLEESARM